LARAVFLTGTPGVGKTTVLLKAVEALERRGLKAGGMVSREVREAGTRIGFELRDLSSGRTGWLSHVRNPVGPQVGRYRVNLADLDAIGVKAIQEAVTREDIGLVAIDEIGPMELFSPAFREAVRKALRSPKPLVGVLHQRAKDRLIEEVRSNPKVTVLEVTYANREGLPESVARLLLGWSSAPSCSP